MSVILDIFQGTERTIKEKRYLMINNLMLNDNELSWDFYDRTVIKSAIGITSVLYDDKSKIICAKVEDKFILIEEILFNCSGDIILQYNLSNNTLNWQFGKMIFDNLLQVLYMFEKKIIAVLINKNHKRQIILIDAINGKTTYVYPVYGYEIEYIYIEFEKMVSYKNVSDKLVAICNGDSSNSDKYLRNRQKFYVDMFNKRLVKTGLYY